MVKKGVGSSDDILGYKKDTFWEIIKISAIAGAIAGGITFLGGLLTILFSWFGIFSFAGGTLFGVSTIYNLFRNVILGAFWGIIAAFLVIKFYDKFPFDTLFKKVFGLKLILNLLVFFTFGLFVLVLLGPISFIIPIASFIIGDYVYAKMISNKIGPLVGLK